MIDILISNCTTEIQRYMFIAGLLWGEILILYKTLIITTEKKDQQLNKLFLSFRPMGVVAVTEIRK